MPLVSSLSAPSTRFIQSSLVAARSESPPEMRASSISHWSTERTTPLILTPPGVTDPL